MLVVAVVSTVRLVAARPWRRDSAILDTDLAHLLMAIAMAGMAAPSLGTLPDVAWEIIFGLLTAWFAGRVVADARRSGLRALAGGHCAPHLVHSASMLYMFLAATAPAARPGGMSGMSGGPGPATMALSHPTLAFGFALVLVGYAIWDLDQLSGRRYVAGARVSLATAGAVPAVDMTVLPGVQSRPAPPPGTAPADAAPGTDQTASAGEVRTALAPEGQAASRGAGAAGAGGPHLGGGRGFLLSPDVTVGGRITMSVAMAVMLLIAL
jgi:hypothetical protein